MDNSSFAGSSVRRVPMEDPNLPQGQTELGAVSISKKVKLVISGRKFRPQQDSQHCQSLISVGRSPRVITSIELTKKRMSRGKSLGLHDFIRDPPCERGSSAKHPLCQTPESGSCSNKIPTLELAIANNDVEEEKNISLVKQAEEISYFRPIGAQEKSLETNPHDFQIPFINEDDETFACENEVALMFDDDELKLKYKTLPGPKAIGNVKTENSSLIRGNTSKTLKVGAPKNCNIIANDIMEPEKLEKMYLNGITDPKKNLQHEESNESFMCTYCGKKYRTRNGFKAHEATVHTKKLKHKCSHDGCNAAFFYYSELTIHTRKHTGDLPFTCSYCGARYISHATLAQHERAAHLQTEDTECPVCKKRLRKRNLPGHLKTHEGYDGIPCSVCGKEFPTIGGKNRHEKIHFDLKHHSCSYCGKSFVQRANMIAHERIHTGERPYKCRHCHEGFPQQTRRNQHEQTCKQKGLCSDQHQFIL